MQRVKSTALLAALLLSSPALSAQEAQPFENVYVDVGGSAVLIPVDLALEACNLDETGVQQAAASRLETSGLEVAGLTDLFRPAGQVDLARTAETVEAMGDTTADADTDTNVDTTAEATTDATTAPLAGDTTQTDHANMTTDAGNATTQTGPADVQGTDIAAADAQQANGMGTLENVEPTAAETSAEAAAPGQELIELAVCQVDAARATALGISGLAGSTPTE